jgi:hypothetical protein
VSLDTALITSLRSHAAAKRINWDTAIVETDAQGPTGDHWSRLVSVVRDASRPMEEGFLRVEAHLLLTNPGLLARYDLLGLLDELREATRKPAPDQVLRTVWVLVPTEDPTALPTVSGKAVPVTNTAERLALPKAWLDNVHRTAPLPTGAAL